MIVPNRAVLSTRSFSSSEESRRHEFLIEPSELADMMEKKKERLKILDCSWYLPHMLKNGYEEFLKARIEGAIFFDLDDICDKKTDLPHMVAPLDEF